MSNEMTPADHALFEANQGADPHPDLLTKARAFATIAHEGQTRKDGKTPYIVHPERVVKLLQKAGVDDVEVLAAAYLHDVLEDTDADLNGVFSERVIGIVKEMTMPPNTIDKKAYLSSFADKSWEAIMVKLADRFDNLSDAENMDPEWVQIYLVGANYLLLAAYRAGIRKDCNPNLLSLSLLTSQLRDRVAALSK